MVERGRSEPLGGGPYTFTFTQLDGSSDTPNDADMPALLPPPQQVPRLSVLKTKAESRAQAETIQVWTVELPVKAANSILM